jgi:hypothetical protein
VPGAELETDVYSSEEFEICRENAIMQLKRGLDLLIRGEKIRRYELAVSPLDLEEARER